MLSAIYAAVARRRRERYAGRPELRRRLRRPVISIGNLAVGGRGKTPLTAAVARLLRDLGERPAILSRGYGRARPERAPVIVRDADGIRADLDRAGDEPLMLARQLPGVCVVTCAERYEAGKAAEQLGASVHVLDDGFQHFQLERDLDLVILAREDVERPVTLPAGHLREPLDTLIAADAVLTEDPNLVVDVTGSELPVFRMTRVGSLQPPDAERVLAVAGIANPDRFFSELRANGWAIVGAMAFADHHRYSVRDVRRIWAEASRLAAVRVVTTEKDLVRLLRFRPFAVPVVHVPIRLEPDPIGPFSEWIQAGLRTVRGESHG